MKTIILHSQDIKVAQLVAQYLGVSIQKKRTHYRFTTDKVVDLEALRQRFKLDFNFAPEHFSIDQAALFVSDMDSTLINIECIDEIAAFAQLKPQVAAITERAMLGELDFYVLKTPWWKAYTESITSSKASDKFVQQLLQDPKIFLQWSRTISNTPFEGNQLLRELGANCNIQQVSASFIKLRRQNLTFWTDIYGEVLLTDKGGNKVDQSPALIIYKDHVRVGPDTIFGWTYENGILTWPLTNDKMPFPNNCSGAITFSDVIHPKKEGGYTGKIFNGILNYSGTSKTLDKIYVYKGQVGDPVKYTPSNLKLGLKGSETRKNINLFIDSLIVTVIIMAVVEPRLLQFAKHLEAKNNNLLGADVDDEPTIKVKLDDGDIVTVPIVKNTIPPVINMRSVFAEKEVGKMLENIRKQVDVKIENEKIKDTARKQAEKEAAEKAMEQQVQESQEAIPVETSQQILQKEMEWVRAADSLVIRKAYDDVLKQLMLEQAEMAQRINENEIRRKAEFDDVILETMEVTHF